MKNKTGIALTLTAAFVMGGCSSTPKTALDYQMMEQEKQQKIAESVLKNSPDWYREAPEDNAQWVYVVGDGLSNNLSTAESMANSVAMSNLAKKLGSQVDGMDSTVVENNNGNAYASDTREYRSTNNQLYSMRVEGIQQVKKKTALIEGGKVAVYVLKRFPYAKWKAQALAMKNKKVLSDGFEDKVDRMYELQDKHLRGKEE